MGKKVPSAAGDFRCANVSCNVVGWDTVNKCCSRCGGAWHCSPECLKQRWRLNGGNHRAHCKPAPKPEGAATAAATASSSSAAAAAAAPRAEGDDDDPVHPCPICLENEDDHGQHGQCSECGRLCCGDCSQSVSQGFFL